MASPKSAPVGRLEAILDDFTEVHGSVLLGMHKEIQTLKDEIQKSVDTQIGALLTEIRKADSELRKSVKTAQRTLAEHKTATKENIASFESASTEAQTVSEKLRQQIATASAVIEDSVAAEMVKLRSVIDDHQAALARDVKIATTGFENALSSGTKTIRGQIDDFQSRMNASLSFTNQINKETRELLHEVRVKETQLRKLTQRLFWVFGPTVLATLGVWIWLVVR